MLAWEGIACGFLFVMNASKVLLDVVFELGSAIERHSAAAVLFIIACAAALIWLCLPPLLFTRPVHRWHLWPFSVAALWLPLSCAVVAFLDSQYSSHAILIPLDAISL